jgi:hypothetical protein
MFILLPFQKGTQLMNIDQKASVYTIVVVVVTALACLALTPFVGAMKALGALGLLGFLGFTPLLFRPGKGGPSFDERDATIARLAWSRGALLAFLISTLVTIAIWLVFKIQARGTISIEVLPVLVGVQGLALFVARAVLVLVLNRTGISNAEG